MDLEPTHLPKNQILLKAKQEREKINLALTTSDPLQNLQYMKYNRHAGQIHAIGLDAFYALLDTRTSSYFRTKFRIYLHRRNRIFSKKILKTIRTIIISYLFISNRYKN